MPSSLVIRYAPLGPLCCAVQHLSTGDAHNLMALVTGSYACALLPATLPRGTTSASQWQRAAAAGYRRLAQLTSRHYKIFQPPLRFALLHRDEMLPLLQGMSPEQATAVIESSQRQGRPRAQRAAPAPAAPAPTAAAAVPRQVRCFDCLHAELVARRRWGCQASALHQQQQQQQHLSA